MEQAFLETFLDDIGGAQECILDNSVCLSYIHTWSPGI